MGDDAHVEWEGAMSWIVHARHMQGKKWGSFRRSGGQTLSLYPRSLPIPAALQVHYRLDGIPEKSHSDAIFRRYKCAIDAQILYLIIRKNAV